MWTVLYVPQEECTLSARVRNDGAAMGPLRHPRDGLVDVEKWQRHFLHNTPLGMCRTMCRRGSGSNSQRRMVDTCFATNQSRRCDFAIWFLQAYFLQ